MSNIIVLSKFRTIGSGRKLADQLGGLAVTPKRTSYPEDAVVVNYGVSKGSPALARHPGKVINSPVAVARAVNKLSSVRAFENKGVCTPEWTTDIGQVSHWLDNGPSSRRVVLARTKLTGSQGSGIVVIGSGKELDQFYMKTGGAGAPMFTRYFPKSKEYRVHVLFGKVAHIVQKRAMTKEKMESMGLKLEEPDRKIRSYKRGWVFSNHVTGSEDGLDMVKQEAIQAVAALGLDFGAVDVLARGQGSAIEEVAVCEVNTAPSLDGDTTIEMYYNAFKENGYV